VPPSNADFVVEPMETGVPGTLIEKQITTPAADE
jgi:uncharacterized protein YceH (UPF0502 family)